MLDATVVAAQAVPKANAAPPLRWRWRKGGMGTWWRSRRPTMAPGHRVYAIGDVHGRYDLLAELIFKIAAEQSRLSPARTFLVFLGDLIDRGPQSAKVLKLVRWGGTAQPRAIVLKGNHEEMLVEAWRGDRDALEGWLEHGGAQTLDSFDEVGCEASPDDGPGRLEAAFDRLRRCVAPDMVEWLDGLPTRWQIGDYAFVHAGVRPGLPLDRQEDADLLWIRDEFLSYPGPHGAVVVHGHTVSEQVEFRPNRIGIDTGAYRTGRLSALCLWRREQRVISTEAEAVLDLAGLSPHAEPEPVAEAAS